MENKHLSDYIKINQNTNKERLDIVIEKFIY